jgi:signal transduction histidine kinase
VWPEVDRRKPGWANDWQSSVESDKAALAQSLHDNTGGLLAAAIMDISWVASRLPPEASAIRERLIRARAALDDAIDLNRRMIEDLRPTLLDNFGLIAALKWHFAETCRSANIACVQHFSEPGAVFLPRPAIALYRVAQTWIAATLTHQPSALTMDLQLEHEYVLLRIGCEGLVKLFTREDAIIAEALASITGRAKAFGGDVHFLRAPDGAAIICQLPASHVLATRL